MKTITYCDLQKALTATLDQVNADREPVMIIREDGKPSAVLMSFEDFASHDETQYLVRSPANAERLLASIAELD